MATTLNIHIEEKQIAQENKQIQVTTKFIN